MYVKTARERTGFLKGVELKIILRLKRNTVVSRFSGLRFNGLSRFSGLFLLVDP